MHDGEILSGAEFRRRFPQQAGALRRSRDQAGRPDAAADRIRAAMAQAQAQAQAQAEAQAEAQAQAQPADPVAAPRTDLAELFRQTPDEDPTAWR